MNMIEQAYFLSGFALCVIITLTIILIIHRKLFVLLTDLCEGEARALFWTSAIEVWFFLYSTSSAMQWISEETSHNDLFFVTVQQLKYGFSGMSTAIVMVSIGLLVFTVIRKITAYENKDLRRNNI